MPQFPQNENPQQFIGGYEQTNQNYAGAQPIAPQPTAQPAASNHSQAPAPAYYPQPAPAPSAPAYTPALPAVTMPFSTSAPQTPVATTHPPAAPYQPYQVAATPSYESLTAQAQWLAKRPPKIMAAAVMNYVGAGFHILLSLLSFLMLNWLFSLISGLLNTASNYAGSSSYTAADAAMVDSLNKIISFFSGYYLILMALYILWDVLVIVFSVKITRGSFGAAVALSIFGSLACAVQLVLVVGIIYFGTTSSDAPSNWYGAVFIFAIPLIYILLSISLSTFSASSRAWYHTKPLVANGVNRR